MAHDDSGQKEQATEAGAVAQRYARFAQEEAPGRSDLYAEWATGVAGDPIVAGIIGRIPANRRQPPLLFAVTRMLGAPEASFAVWARWLIEHADLVVADASHRRLQTNEPQRCAALLPALSLVDGPIALLELGASAGLCLLPDRYSYRYAARDGSTTHLDPAAGESTVVLHCDVDGDPPLRMPEIVWRGGIDLTPLDAGDADDRRFLTSLVWPGESGRAERIIRALDIAASERLTLIEGDVTDPAVLERAAASAPPEATLVISTPGVLPHIPRAQRERLVDAIRAMDAAWVTIDPATLHEHRHPSPPGQRPDGFVLALDGVSLAHVDPLGAFVEWHAGALGVAR